MTAGGVDSRHPLANPAGVRVGVGTGEVGIPPPAERMGYRTASAFSLAVPAPPSLSRKWSFSGSGCRSRISALPEVAWRLRARPGQCSLLLGRCSLTRVRASR